MPIAIQGIEITPEILRYTLADIERYSAHVASRVRRSRLKLLAKEE